MRFVLFLLLAPSVAVSIAAGLSDGNHVAMGFAIGCTAPLVLAAALLVKPRPKPLLRKADPAKIARLERELGMEPTPERREGPQEGARAHPRAFTPAECRAIDLADAAGLNGNARRNLIADYLEGYAQGLAEEAPTEPDIMDTPDALHAVETGCTTMLVAPDVEDCPRPEACVMAHPCRKCGAGRGMWCVGDPYVEQVAEGRRKAYGA